MVLIRKYTLSLIAILLIGLFFVKENIILDTSTQYTSDIAKDSAAVYLSLRGVNAALSFVEEIEVNASIVVASGTIQPFKVLEPIDDAIERMSSAIFYVGVAAATTTVILEFFGRYGFLVFGIALGIQQIFMLSGWVSINGPASRVVEGIRNSAGIILIALMSFFVSSTLSDKISDKKWLEYRELLNDIASEMDELSSIDQFAMSNEKETFDGNSDVPTTPDNHENSNTDRALKWAGDLADNLMDKGQKVADTMRDATSGAMNTMIEKYNLAEEITAKFWERKDELVEALTAIFALFIFKTFILPLMLFLFIYGSVRGAFLYSKS